MTEHHHAHTHPVADREELLALVRYMADHNASHTAELASLAAQVEENSPARTHLEAAIALYQDGNDRLTEALRQLESEE